MASLIVHASVSLILHILLIVYGDFHDKQFADDGPLYTDVDYRVVTDAAKYVLQNESPYRRTTYRYTPILAYLVTPNLFLHEYWGKLLFSICNVFVGLLIGWILPINQQKYALLWFYNPMSAVLATRGSYESMVAALVLAMLYNAKQSNERTWITGILLALATHFKIYPVIYSLALYFHVDGKLSLHPTYRRFQLVFSFLLTTLMFNGIFYYCYGYTYLHETYLYHITRRDARHNFSPYFYLTYLRPDNSLLPFVTFIPQIFNTLVFSCRLYDRLELCLFALTFSFVTFNKVTTSQYFLWYLIFIPILLPNIYLTWKKLFLLLVAWLAAQGWWLYHAYQLEFQGKNTFAQIWLASIVFGFVNVIILCAIIYNYRQIVVSVPTPAEKSASEKKND
ncbi:unnamed protein product [Rotaria socialis]|uniref:GPI alpha-1,4-mannosyltransferase I, catalytic subunit n=4 Tax=Rotaria socialis TaxID=392032 RepID=A0A817UR57_9BILA|nr:unnamed protein product [Rotaria socialis]CAF3665708.1 unnamed protein product [Rotaria socialis]CAF4298185.1 unnamed protein product [Rotaria socialis]